MGMGGNVYQWMESASSGSNTNPTEYRVTRGGSWVTISAYLLSSSRIIRSPSVTDNNLGIRVASIPDPAPPVVGDFSLPVQVYQAGSPAVTFTITPPTTTPSLPGTWSFTSSDPRVATVSGNQVTVTGQGWCSITATFPASGFYLAATTSAILVVKLPDATLANLPSLSFVSIGNSGNSADTNGYGAVPYNYAMGTYAISGNQLRAASTNGLPFGGTAPGDQPFGGLYWYSAAAYVNWLNTSQGYAPAYNLSLSYSTGYSMKLWPASQAWTLGGVNLYRNANCRYFLPSENEWYKAAYYDPNKGGNGGYWRYPQGIDTVPTSVRNGTSPGTAVYNLQNASPTASVFSAGGLSPYGCMGMGGNIYQWMESASSGINTVPSANRVVRGGSSSSSPSSLSKDTLGLSRDPSIGINIIGFRVAALPSVVNTATITPALPQSVTYYLGATVTVTPNSTSPGAFTYSLASGAPSGTSINSSSGVVTIGGAGTINVLVTQAAAANCSAVTAAVPAGTIKVNPATPTITPAAAQSVTYSPGATAAVIPTSTSPGAFTYSLASGAPIGTSINASSGVVTIVRVGTINVLVKQASTTNYTAVTTAVPVGTITVSPATPIITPVGATTQTVSKSTTTSVTVTATSQSTGMLTYSLAAGYPTGTTINSNTGRVAISTAGTIRVQVTQAAAGNYAAVRTPVTLRTITVTQ